MTSAAVTVSSTSASVATKPGHSNSLQFDGTNDLVAVDGVEAIYGSAYSIAFWIKGTDQAGECIISFGANTTNQEFRIRLRGAPNGDKINIFMETDGLSVLVSASSSTSVLDDTWHHVAWVDDNGSYKFYVDGVEDLTGSYTPGTLTLDRTGIACLRRNTDSGFFAGKLDSVRFWSVALTEAQVGQDFAGTRVTTGLAHEYLFDGDSSTVAVDTAGSVDGVITEAVRSEDIPYSAKL